MSIIIMILLLGFLILVHELGHFIAARALGIKVSKFGLGFPIGPTLWSKKIGDVEYLIHACLIGGYVAFPDDEKDSNLPLDSKERFQNNPVWKRMIVISAGVLTNLAVAFLLVFLVAGFWGELPSGISEVYVGKLAPEINADITKSGLKVGDRIIDINGSDITSNYAVSLFTKYSAQYDGKTDRETIDKAFQQIQELNPWIKSDTIIKKGQVVKLPIIQEPRIEMMDDVLNGLAYYEKKELPLDEKRQEIRDSLKGKTEYKVITNVVLMDLAFAVADNVHPIDITVERDGKIIKLPSIYANKDGLIGFVPTSKSITIKTKTPKEIISYGSEYLWKQTAFQLYGFGQLLAGKIPAKEIHGIVAVAKIGGDVINKGGMASGLLLTAILSAWLAILNFLPIPALDGGHMMFLIIEKIIGKPVSEKFIERTSTIFFAILIILALLIIGNDIFALITHQL